MNQATRTVEGISEATLARLAGALPHILRGLSGTPGEACLQAAVCEISRAIGADFCFVGRLLDATAEIRTLAIAADGEPPPEMRYALAGTPCARVVDAGGCLFVQGVAERFPGDRRFTAMGVTGYLGTPLHDARGRVIGLLVALWRKSVPDAELARAVFDLLGTCIAAQIERAGRDPDRLRSDASLARRIVTDLAHFALVAEQPLLPGPVDAVPLFVDAVEAHRPPTPAVVIEHPEHCIVEADPVMLAILIDNLVSNAVKYSIRRAEIRVVLGSRPGCSFYVRDNGCGFPQARAADIFRPFHRLHDPREYEGTGIGLATVARIVARHAGRVWAEGEEDWGATVYVALPPAA